MFYTALFGSTVAFSLLVWSLVGQHYFWPALRDRNRADAVRPILYVHAFRFMGLSFLMPGVVSPELPLSFARPVAYGDLATAVLALLALAALNSRASAATIWLFNIVGAADLLNAFYQGNRITLVPGQMGAAYFIPTFIVPFLLVTHALVFRILLRPEPASIRHGLRQAA